MKDGYVLARIDPPGIFNFYETHDAALTDLARANAGDVTYQPMTYEAFQAARRAFYLADEPAQITEEQFIYALEVLPPMAHRGYSGFESFLMAEYFSVPYTSQYVRRGSGDAATYWTRMVDATDRSTWMDTREDGE